MKLTVVPVVLSIVCGLVGLNRASAQALEGATLYNNNCTSCHSYLATSNVRGTTAAQTRAAINANFGNMGQLLLSDAQLQAIAEALSNTPVHVTGQLVSNNGGILTISSAGTQSSVATNANTTVTITGIAATVAGLKAGMAVHVTSVGGTATAIVATIPILHVAGPITAINGVQITLQQTTGPTTFLTDANTKVTVKAKASIVAALKIGMHVTGTTELGTATLITATVPIMHVAGPITAINGAQITIQATTGPVSFATDSNTKVTLTAKASTVAALKVGMHMTGTTELGKATLIAATVPIMHVSGPIMAITGSQITIQTTTGPVTFLIDANTKITLNAKAATLADLKDSQTLAAVTALGTATTVTAKG